MYSYRIEIFKMIKDGNINRYFLYESTDITTEKVLSEETVLKDNSFIVVTKNEI